MSVVLNPTKPNLPPVRAEFADFETLSGGLGGWESLDRPRQTSAAGWVGLPARTLSLPLVLDGMEAYGVGADRNVQPDVSAVLEMGKPTRQTGEPPLLQVTGVAQVSAASRWVVQDVELGEPTRNEAGVIVQQYLTVTLLAYVEADLVKGPAAKARRRHKAKAKAKSKGK